MLRVALIGFGAMGRALAMQLQPYSDHAMIIGALELRDESGADRSLLRQAPLVRSMEELEAQAPDIVVECAGHEALQSYGPLVLRHRHDLLVASIGALADPVLERELRAEATGSGTRVLLASGAIGGLDALAAARIAGLEQVNYIGRKPVAAWRSTAAERRVDLNAPLSTATAFFEGDARQAALEFPQNANVASAIALVGLGFEATRVQLVVDPALTRNEHAVSAKGRFGEFTFVIRGEPLPENSKTSMLAPSSLVRGLLNRRAVVALS